MRRDPDPIVSAEGDPVGTGFVVSLAPPGGNITGLSFHQTDLAIKRLELLREVVPALRRLAILAVAGNPVTLRDMREVEVAARNLRGRNCRSDASNVYS